jgi:hypothetical protein
MRNKNLVLLLIAVIAFSCKKHKETIVNQPPVTNEPPVLLKDIVIPNLPSPFYHFEYNESGKPIFASYASGLTMYNIVYSGNRISELKNNIIVNKDRLQYSYDDAGRVTTIMYADSLGVAYKKIVLEYEGQKLTTLTRLRILATGLLLEKTMVFTYLPDGNLSEIIEDRPPLNGQPGTTTGDRFEQYDNKINTDGFSLLHGEFFDHLVFLPGVQLQKNNPGKVSHFGSGDNYQVTYTYTYNDRKAPLTKSGTGTWQTGPNTGQTFPTTSIFTYY